MAVLYEKGRGVAENYAAAAKWERRAAEQGSAVGEYGLGLMYARGHSLPQNYNIALKWYRKAAAQGYASAENNIGAYYDHGIAVPLNYIKATHWYRKAAVQGSAVAELNLGFLYVNGRGVGRNDAIALKYWLLARADARRARWRLAATRLIRVIEQRLPPAEIQQARAMAAKAQSAHQELLH